MKKRNTKTPSINRLYRAVKVIFGLVLLGIMTSCGSDDDEGPQLEFTEADLILMHGESEKSWSVKEVYADYSDNIRADLEACHQDDIYTFKANTREVAVALGDTSCFWAEPDSEGASVLYTYDPESGKLFLDHGRGEAKGAETLSLAYIMRLNEISETQMLFSNGTKENPGSAILFEATN